jgi:Protein of unknown function (DUF3489)
MKLTDTQLLLLSAAAQREDGGIELAPNLKGGAAQNLVRKLLNEGLIEEVRATGSLPVWRRKADNRSLALHITKRGLAVIKVEEAGGAPQQAEVPTSTAQPADVAPGKPRGRVAAAHRAESTRQKSRDTSQAGSKQARVVELLRSRQGATIAAIVKATGWQPHSVRGFLAAVVRNKLDLTLVSDKTGTERVYRIIAGKAATKSKGKSGRKAA